MSVNPNAPSGALVAKRVLSIRALRRAGCRVALCVWVLSGCSRVDAPNPTATEQHAEDRAQLGGTGTRAKGEEGALGMQGAAKSAPAEANEATTRRYAVKGPPASPLEAAPSFGMIGALFGGGSLGIANGAGPVPSRQARDFNTEGYRHIDDNPFDLVRQSPLSTFSIDVDTASYSNMRRFIEQGQVPPKDAIRTEEWINYFHYDDPVPESSEPFRVTSELSVCPWAPEHRLMRIALNTRAISQEKVPPRNLVFLVDVSGSMEDENKLPLLRRGLSLLARSLRRQDTLSIVVYAGASGLALPPTSGADQDRILDTLNHLQAGGSTNGAEGIQLAYNVARSQFKRDAINRVLLATDGDFNVGVTSEGDLQRLIEAERKSGVFLTVLGFGEGNLQDAKMELLADKGNGNYAYIDSLAEARKVLVREAGATLVTVAKDVKIQVEFNPTRVGSYRLVGYENRLLADRDFNDDTKDAGEIGAGHHVTALYELTPVGEKAPVRAVDPLKYQSERTASSAAGGVELATIKLRYKEPSGSTSRLVTQPVLDQATALDRASESLRFSAAVAEYALLLREAPGVSQGSFEDAHRIAAAALGNDELGERREFLSLMDRATSVVRAVKTTSLVTRPAP